MSEKISSIISPDEVPEIYSTQSDFVERTKLESSDVFGLIDFQSPGYYVPRKIFEMAGLPNKESYIYALRFEGKNVPNLVAQLMDQTRMEIEKNPKSPYYDEIFGVSQSIEEFYLMLNKRAVNYEDEKRLGRTRREIDLAILRHEATHWQHDRELGIPELSMDAKRIQFEMLENIDTSLPEGAKAIALFTYQLQTTLGYAELESYLSQYINYENAPEDSLRATGAIFAALGTAYLQNQSYYESEDTRKYIFLMYDQHILAGLSILLEDGDLLERARQGSIDINDLDDRVAKKLDSFIKGDNLVPRNLLNPEAHAQIHKHLSDNAKRLRNMSA